jgi:uncharacterized membrane protein
MSSFKKRLGTSFHWKNLLQYFFQGLIIIVPVGITIYVVLTLFNMVDSILPNLLYSLFPRLMGTGTGGELRQFPGLGFIVVILIVILFGRISSSFVMSRLVDLLDSVLERTPGIKLIYSSVKDFLEAFTGNKRKFDKPVLANVDAPDVWRIGFITRQSAEDFDLHTHVVVYIPLSYALTGVTYFVPKEKIKPLDKVSSAEAMKFAVTGGVTEVDDHHSKHTH